MKRIKLIILVLISFVVLHLFSFAVLSSEADLIDKPLGEDAYYMFSIARNIARGEGVVYNYGILTNGFQPLIMLPYTAIYYLSIQLEWGQWVPLRLILLLNIFFLLVTALLMRRTVKIYCKNQGYRQEVIDMAGSLTLLLFVANINMVRLYLYGLETGLYLLLLVLLISRLVSFSKLSDIPIRHAFLLGILSGLTVLARIDFFILLGGMLLSSIIMDKKSLPQAAIIGSVALIVASPWFLYNYLYFDSVMPSSGTAQSVGNLDYHTIIRTGSVAFWTVLDQILTLFWLPKGNLPFETIILGAKILAIVSGVFFTKRYIQQLLRWPFTGFALGYFMLISAYIIMIGATHFYQRYFAPGLVLWLILLPILIALLLERSSSSKIQHTALITLSLGTIVIYGLFAGYTLHRGAISNTHVYTVWWLDDNSSFDNPTRVGAFQSGVIGYFHENVYNLDGKVNPDALEHLLEDDMDCYILEEGIQYVIDWPGYIENKLSEDFRTSHTQQITQIPGGTSIIISVDIQEPFLPCQARE